MGMFLAKHTKNCLEFGTLVYPDHPQNQYDFGYSLLVFPSSAPLGLNETDHIWGFQAFSGEHMWVTKFGMLMYPDFIHNLLDLGHDLFILPICCQYDLVKLFILGVYGRYLKNVWE